MYVLKMMCDKPKIVKIQLWSLVMGMWMFTTKFLRLFCMFDNFHSKMFRKCTSSIKQQQKLKLVTWNM